jgi:CHAT domain-containing protein
VFISACSSGLGAVISNFAPTGIRQRFIEAGARCVIATLWPIKDEAALLLCRTFYEAAFKGGARVSEALQQAKERVRQQFPDVRDWAPVVAYGDDVDQL